MNNYFCHINFLPVRPFWWKLLGELLCTSVYIIFNIEQSYLRHCYPVFLLRDLSHLKKHCYLKWGNFFLLFQPGKDGIILPALCILRIVFLPLFAFCNAQPRHDAPVFFGEDYYPIVFMVLFAISNGYLGSLCMMYGPS